MIELLEAYGLEGLLLIVLTSLIPIIRKRIINDTNMLETFKIAKDSIKDSNNIKFNVNDAINNVRNQVDEVKTMVDSQIKEFQETILAFQEDELYKKMLLGLSELDELHETLQNKDATIEMLGKELKDTRKILLEIKNKLKG